MKKCKAARSPPSLLFSFLAQIAILIVLGENQVLVSASHLPEEHLSTNGQPLSENGASYSDDAAVELPFGAKKYSTFNATCDDKKMSIDGHFYNNFSGRIYAYDYSDEPECGGQFAPSKDVSFDFPLDHCGIQMKFLNGDYIEQEFEVTIYIQYSSFLQQMIDEKVAISCLYQKKIEEETQQGVIEEEIMPNSRQGRKLKMKEKPIPKTMPKIGESSMEILSGKDPSPKIKKSHPIAVGEDITLVVTTRVNRGHDARVVNCTAHDGSRSGSDNTRAQQILDSSGCSVDKGLVPNFRRRRLPTDARNKFITLHFATFPAFKFPERGHLHLKCTVAYCQGPCPQEACDSGKNHFGTWKDKYGRIAEVLVDSTEIANSVEITAPDLEDTGGHRYERHQSGLGSGTSGDGTSSRQFSDSTSSSRSSTSSGPKGDDNYGNRNQTGESVGSNTVCVSPGTLIMALVILGVILVISATVTLWFALKRSEARKYQQKHALFQPAPSSYYRFSHW